MNTPFSQLLHKNSFLSNTTELHAWMRKINLSIIKLDCVKIVKLFTFEIRKKTQKHTVNQWLLSIVNFFNIRSSYFWLKTFSPFINVRWRLRPYTIYLRKIYFQKYTLPEYSLFLFVCVCNRRQRLFQFQCLISVKRTACSSLTLTAIHSRHLSLPYISVDGISGQWRKFYRHIHRLMVLKLAFKKTF